MLYNKIILVPYKDPKGSSNVEWYIQVDESTKINFEIGPFECELLAAQFMDGTEQRYEDFMSQLSKFAEEG